MSGQKQVEENRLVYAERMKKKIELNIPLSSPLFPPMKENVAKDNQL